MKRILRIAGAVATVAALLVLIAFARATWHWVEIHTGVARGGPDPYYNFWSGIGSDFGEYVIAASLITGIVSAYRHHNCHVSGCPRLGKPVAGTPYLACHIHHPGHEGTNRNVSVTTIEAAYTPPTKGSP